MRESGHAAGKADRGERQIGKEQSQRGQKDQTIGQGRSGRDKARQSESESEKRSKDQTVGQGRSDRDKARQSERGKQDKSTTTGTAARDKAAQDKTTRDENAQPGQTTGATTRDQRTAPAQGQTSTQAQGQGTTAQTQTMAGRTFTAQQQTRLQQSVLHSRNVQRARVDVNSINFRINTGVVVPRRVHFVSVAAYPVLIDVFPAYRDYDFFVVEDEIVFVDDDRRIVDVVPAGPRARFARGSRGSGGSVAVLDLSPEEIRIVQQVLIERGLYDGEVDGILGPDTREALIIFQRREGIEATGSIDTRTVTALGVSNRISATQSQTTTGQGQGGQQPSAQQGRTDQNAGQSKQNQQPTTGQAGKQRPAGETTGQAPAKGSKQPSANRPSAKPSQDSAPSTKGQSDQGGSGRKY